MDHRKRYIEEILTMKQEEVLLIGVDETPLDFGGSRNIHVSAPYGTAVFVDKDDPRFSKMQWDAICGDTRVRRVVAVWNREDEEQTQALMARLKVRQQELKDKVDKQRAQALVPGTTEYWYLEQLNTEVEAHNALLPKGQRVGKRQRFKANRAFKYDSIERDHKKGGLDFVWYAFKIYEDKLFGFYEDIQRLNPSMIVYIVEDNIGVHHKARRLLAPQIALRGIKFLDIPTYSPDLHPIESLHKDQKKELEDFRFMTTSAAQVVQHKAEAEMERVWCDSSHFDELVKIKASLSYYQGLARRSKHSDPPYGNRYKDSI